MSINYLTRFDGRRVAYVEYGEPNGHAIFCLHGTPGSGELYAIADKAARERQLRLIALDRPGYGHSDACPNWTFEEPAGDIVALADHLGVNEFSLLGFSGGGPHAVFAMRRLAPRVRVVALVSAFAPGESVGPVQRFFMKLACTSIPAAHAVAKLLAWCPASIGRRLACMGVSRSDHEVMRDPEIQQGLTHGLTSLRHHSSGLVREAALFAEPWKLPPALHLDPPLWIWHGTDDTIVSPDAGLLYSHTFAQARFTLLPGMGHYWGLAKIAQVLEVFPKGGGSVP